MRCRCKKVMVRPTPPHTVFQIGSWYDYNTYTFHTGLLYSVQDQDQHKGMKINDHSGWSMGHEIFLEHFDTEAEVREIEIDKILNG